MHQPKCLIATIIIVFFASIFLVSCAPSLPVFVEEVWSLEPPEVGKIVTMGLRIKSVTDEENIVFVLAFPDMIAVFDSPSRWEFGLKSRQEEIIHTDICVLETGSWLIDVSIASFFDDGEMKYGDRKVIGIVSYPSEAKVILEKDITYSQAVETERAKIPSEKISAGDCAR